MKVEHNPDQNSFKFTDPRAQEVSDIWHKLHDASSQKQRDEVGKTFMRNILKVDEETIVGFTNGNLESQRKVGMKQAGIPVDEANTESFWKDVNSIFPDLHPKDQLHFLVKEGGVFGAMQLLFQLEVTGSERIGLLRDLAINAHAYK